MPRIDPGTPTKKPPVVVQPNPDQRAPTKAPRRPVAFPSPDARDVTARSPRQKTHDAQVVARTVKTARGDVLVQGRRAAVRHVASSVAAHIVPSGRSQTPATEAAIATHRKQEAAAVAPVLNILNQTTRPLHGLAAAAKADVQTAKAKGVGYYLEHGSPAAPKAALRGVENKDKTTFSDVLGEAGWNPHSLLGRLAKGATGTAADIALDPTTYLSFGTASTARDAAEAAGRKATKDALKAGASDKAANKAGRIAAGEAKQHANTGVTLGFGGQKTSGRATAAAGRALHVPQASEKLRGSVPGRLVRQLAPSLRPAGVSPESFAKVRAAVTRGRAVAVQGEKQARNKAIAISRALGGGSEHPQITDALESRSTAGLSDKDALVAKTLAHEYDAMHATEHAAGLVGPKFKEFGYSPRRPVSDLEPGGSRRRMSGAQLASSKARTNRAAYATFRGSGHDIYTENAPLAYYMRARDSAVKLGRKQVIDALHAEGKRWHPGQEVKTGEEIYKFAPRKMPEAVEGDELKSIMGGGAPPGLNEYRVLPKNLVHVAANHVPPALDEDTGLIHRIWDRQVQGRVKTILTVPNPQYHLTNLYGDVFNAYKAAPAAKLAKNLGISVAALTYKARREAAAKTLGKQLDPASRGVVIGGKRFGLDQLVKEAEDHGAIGQGFIGRDLAETLDAQGKEAAEKLGQGAVTKHLGKVGGAVGRSKVAGKLTHPINSIRDISQYREDAVRLALYLQRRKGGATADQATAFVNQHLFDYGDLTPFERGVLRRVLPFYTFSARNFPQQVKALLQHPGKYATLEKVREEALKASGVPPGYEKNLQKYEQQGIPIPIPGTKNLVYTKLPATDLGRLTIKDQANYLMGMVTPLIKSPVELTQNYSFFLRKPIDELANSPGPDGQTAVTLKPAPPAILWALAHSPGGKEIAKALHMTPYADKKTGKRVIGWPAKLDYVWRQTPETTFASQAGSQIPNTRGQSPGQAAFGYLSGLKVVPYSPPDVAQNRAGQAYDYDQAKAKQMRHDGNARDAKGTETAAYREVLNDSKKQAKTLGIGTTSKPSTVSPEETQALLRGIGGSSTAVNPDDPQEVAALLRGIGR